MKDNKKFYLGNKNLPAVGTEFEYTPEQLSELVKCEKNLIYFAEKYFTIRDADGIEETIKLRDYQKTLLRSIRDNRYNVCLSPRQSGKCVQFDTNITVRHRATGEVKTVKIGDFYQSHQQSDQTTPIPETHLS